MSVCLHSTYIFKKRIPFSKQRCEMCTDVQFTMISIQNNCKTRVSVTKEQTKNPDVSCIIHSTYNVQKHVTDSKNLMSFCRFNRTNFTRSHWAFNVPLLLYKRYDETVWC